MIFFSNHLDWNFHTSQFESCNICSVFSLLLSLGAGQTHSRSVMHTDTLWPYVRSGWQKVGATEAPTWHHGGRGQQRASSCHSPALLLRSGQRFPPTSWGTETTNPVTLSVLTFSHSLINTLLTIMTQQFMNIEKKSQVLMLFGVSSIGFVSISTASETGIKQGVTAVAARGRDFAGICSQWMSRCRVSNLNLRHSFLKKKHMIYVLLCFVCHSGCGFPADVSESTFCSGGA